MKLMKFGFMKREQVFRKITKEQVLSAFKHPASSSELMVTDALHNPVFLLKTYPYETGWEFFETGRAAIGFINGEQSVLFKEDAKCVGDYKFDAKNIGNEKIAMEYIEKLPEKLYQVKIEDLEDELSNNGAMSWNVFGMQVHTGQEVTLCGYDDGNGEEYPDFKNLTGKIRYSFRRGEPLLILNKPLKGYRVFRNGQHVYTKHSYLSMLPLGKCKIA